MPDLPYEVERAQWSSDGKSIYFLANMGVHAELFKVNVQSPKPEQLTAGQALAQRLDACRRPPKRTCTPQASR